MRATCTAEVTIRSFGGLVTSGLKLLEVDGLVRRRYRHHEARGTNRAGYATAAVAETEGSIEWETRGGKLDRDGEGAAGACCFDGSGHLLDEFW